MSKPTFVVMSSTVGTRSVIRLTLVLPGIRQSLRRGFARAALLPCSPRVETHPLPLWVRRVLQVPGEVWKLFDLRGQHRRFDAQMLAVSDRPKQLREPAAPGYRGVPDFAVPDELRSESGRAAPLAGRTSQDQRIAAVFDDAVRHGHSAENHH